MVNYLMYLIAGIFALYGVYFIVTGLLGFYKMHKSNIKEYSPQNKFAVVIPARNEENVIVSLIHSLKNQDYPQELYDIFVISNNCTDNTRAKALEAGAIVLNCKREVKSKGEVLEYAFKKLKKNKDVDAYVFFDADNVVHKDFLKRMNDALCDGYEIAQGNRDSKNPFDNWISGCFSIYYWMQNVFFNRGRMFMNASSGTNGTGFMVKKSIIDKEGFSSSTLTEDLEFTTQNILKGRRIGFVENAITYDEQTSSFKDSIHQRSRWTSGSLQTLAKYRFQMFKEFYKTGNISILDLWLKLLMPHNQVFGVLFSIISFFYFDNFDILKTLEIAVISLLVSYLLQIILGIILAYYYKKGEFVKMFGSIVLFPFFLITWIPINIKCFICTDKTWKPIKHSRNIKINELSLEEGD